MAILAVVVSFFLVLAVKNIAPFGATIEYHIDLDKSGGRSLPSPLVPSSFLGVDESGAVYQVPQTLMKSDVVTFDLKTPYRNLKSAEVKIRFRGDPPELLMGIRGDPSSKYVFLPVNNRSLNKLGWNRLEDEGITLFQKEAKYSDLKQFLSHPPMPGNNEVENPTIATYYFDMPQPHPALDPNRIDSGSEVKVPLTGNIVFYTYVDKKPLRVSFDKRETNSEIGFDDVFINVYKDSTLVWGTRIPDDGDDRANGISSEPKVVDFAIPNLVEGVYRVELISNKDVIVENLRTDQGYLVFADEINLVNLESFGLGPSKPISVFTNTDELYAWTENRESIHTTVSGGNMSLTLEEEKKKYLLDLPPGLNEVKIDKGGVVLSSKGNFFSFSKESFFNPFPLKLEEYNEALLSTDLSYIVTSYSMPVSEGDWLVKELKFNLDGMEIVDGKLNCVLLAPNLSKMDGEITLGSIDIVLKKD